MDIIVVFGVEGELKDLSSEHTLEKLGSLIYLEGMTETGWLANLYLSQQIVAAHPDESADEDTPGARHEPLATFVLLLVTLAKLWEARGAVTQH